MDLLVKKLKPTASLPKRATNGSAGFDLVTCTEKDIVVKPGEIVKVPTGIAVAPQDDDVVLLIYSRSSLATKYGICLANSVGVVDSDYRGEIIVPILNLGTMPYTIKHGERIAQLVISPVIIPRVLETTALSQTVRGIGGFGSTGKI